MWVHAARCRRYRHRERWKQCATAALGRFAIPTGSAAVEAVQVESAWEVAGVLLQVQTLLATAAMLKIHAAAHSMPPWP